MSKVQFIYGEDGARLYAVVPAALYGAMSEAAEDRADLADAEAIEARIAAGEPVIPGEIVNRICDGDNPVRVWRQHRGLKARELADRAGISQAFLSQIETGKKNGSFRVMAALARALEIDIDELAPAAS